MEDDRDELLRAYRLVATRRVDFVPHLLGRLFAACPDAERVFEEAGFDHHRRMTLGSMSTIAQLANQAVAEQDVAAIRRAHERAGVELQHLEAYQREFPRALRFMIGAAWTPEMGEACERMVQAAVRLISEDAEAVSRPVD